MASPHEAPENFERWAKGHILKPTDHDKVLCLNDRH